MNNKISDIKLLYSMILIVPILQFAVNKNFDNILILFKTENVLNQIIKTLFANDLINLTFFNFSKKKTFETIKFSLVK